MKKTKVNLEFLSDPVMLLMIENVPQHNLKTKAENHGDHYQSLVPEVSPLLDNEDDSEEDNDGNVDLEDESTANVNTSEAPIDHGDETGNEVLLEDQDENDEPSLNCAGDIHPNSCKCIPFTRGNLCLPSRFFKHQTDRMPLPRIYIPELPVRSQVISVRKIIALKGKSSGTVLRLKEIINSNRWHLD